MARATADELKKWQGELETPGQDDDPALPGTPESTCKKFQDGQGRL